MVLPHQYLWGTQSGSWWKKKEKLGHAPPKILAEHQKQHNTAEIWTVIQIIFPSIGSIGFAAAFDVYFPKLGQGSLSAKMNLWYWPSLRNWHLCACYT